MAIELTRQDLDVLFEAVERWETDDMAGEIMGDIMQSMMSGKDPEMAAKIQLQRETERRKREQAKRQRKERGVVLRAKLITIRDSLEASAFVESGGAFPAESGPFGPRDVR